MGGGDVLFENIADIVTDGGVPLRKFKSKVSGLTVCIAETEGPIVHGYLCVATEAHDDDGLPHTLEHVVFMGSEKYPYKGVLDLLSNLCLASGTNAWTDVDHTCYTMTTAGHEGFLKLLPIYLEHLLYPTLTDAAYVTEVHHINAEGEDCGVVYSEMQGRVNTGESRCHLAMLRAMYPGDCGYKSETGGLLENLRKSTSNEKVRAFHKAFYRPENLNVIIVGHINAEDVFKALQPVEERIAADGERPPFKRPWQSEVPPLLESAVLDVKYPCDKDDFGLAIVAWRGPQAKDYSELISVEILLEYLADTSISPLQRDFVECDDPLCSYVDYTVVENSESCIYLHFANVPVEKLESIKGRLLTLFQSIANGDEEIDMKRMETVIHKKELHILSGMESGAHKHIAMCLIGDFLYGNTTEDLRKRVCQIPIIQELQKENANYWRLLLKTYMLDGNHVVVLGYPDPELSKQMTAEEEQRIEEQRKALGPEGLKQKGEILAKSVQANEVLPPDELLNSMEVPSVESIQFHTIRRCNNVEEQCSEIEDFSLSKMPCRFQLDVVRTNFVRVYTLLDTSDVPQRLRIYLPLFVELITESPICRDGVIIPYQEVVKQLDIDAVSATVSLGFSYSRFSCQKYAQVICLQLMLEEKNYSKGIQWIKEILYQSVFEPSRIKTIANKMLTDVSGMRRHGTAVMKTLMVNLCFTPESNRWMASMMRQYCFLTELCKKLQSDPDQVVKELDELRDIVTDVGRLTIHLAVGQSGLKQKLFPAEPWINSLLPSTKQPSVKKNPIKQCFELLKSFSSQSERSMIVGLTSVEASFVLVSAPCINSYTHPDYPALLVFLQYLNQVEGPLWRKIRGMGLTYCCNLYAKPHEGLIYFFLYRSVLPVNSYKEGMNIIDSYLTKESPWDPSLLKAAKSSLVFEIVDEEETVANIVSQSVSAYYRGVDLNYTKDLLQKISKVTTEDMEKAGTTYLRPLFDPSLSKCSVCCHSSKVEEIVEGFKEFSRELSVLDSLEDPFLTEY